MSSTEVAAPEKSKIVYRAQIEVEPRPGMLKLVTVPAEPEPVPMGMHGDLAKHFQLAAATYLPHASTLDYVIAAAAACMTGVLARALTVREIPIADGRLKVETTGDVETNEHGILVIRRIHFLAHLKAEEGKRAAAERVIRTFEKDCPVYQSLHKAIEITAALDFQPIPSA